MLVPSAILAIILLGVVLPASVNGTERPPAFEFRHGDKRRPLRGPRPSHSRSLGSVTASTHTEWRAGQELLLVPSLPHDRRLQRLRRPLGTEEKKTTEKKISYEKSLLEGNDAEGDERDVVPSVILEARSSLILVPP